MENEREMNQTFATWDEYETYLRQTDPEEEKYFKLLDEEIRIINEIRRIREQKDISQLELAKRTGMKQPAVARMESLTSVPNLETVLKVLLAMDCTIDVRDLRIQKRAQILQFSPLSYMQTQCEYYGVDDGMRIRDKAVSRERSVRA